MEIPLSCNEYLTAHHRWEHGQLIQEAFPTLDADQREFIRIGVSPEEWDTIHQEFESPTDESFPHEEQT